jgi:hypothetical protein
MDEIIPYDMADFSNPFIFDDFQVVAPGMIALAAMSKMLKVAISHGIAKMNQESTLFHFIIVRNEEWSDLLKSSIVSHSTFCTNNKSTK